MNTTNSRTKSLFIESNTANLTADQLLNQVHAFPRKQGRKVLGIQQFLGDPLFNSAKEHCEKFGIHGSTKQNINTITAGGSIVSLTQVAHGIAAKTIACDQPSVSQTQAIAAYLRDVADKLESAIPDIEATLKHNNIVEADNAEREELTRLYQDQAAHEATLSTADYVAASATASKLESDARIAELEKQNESLAKQQKGLMAKLNAFIKG
ncbi:hypothetical protein [Shewanella sp. UCD-KL21]|uniref:hypothetical protein n=1 Tax=Shewanella sp. UCD-KL21 TaxID=1917164 RepID=UPI00097141FA|nr:hypothetical protein [Shewanella sp. UCD-KL21]